MEDKIMKEIKLGDGGMPESTANKTAQQFVDNVFKNKKPLTEKDETVKLTFTVTQDQYDQYEKWVNEQSKKAVKIQKKEVKNPGPEHEISWKMGYPYCGAIGGEITWEFTPTGLGDCLVVKHSVTKEELNLTDYDSW